MSCAFPHSFRRRLFSGMVVSALSFAAAAPPQASDPAFARKLDGALQKNLPEAQAEALLSETELRLLKSPKNRDYLEAAGLLHARFKRWENAKMYLDRLEKPSTPALMALARCHFELGEFRRAAEALKRNGDPARAPETWELYALSLQKAGRRAEALAQWERMRQKHPVPVEALGFLADAYRQRGAGNREKLLPVLEELIRRSPDAPEQPVWLLEAARMLPSSQPQAAEYRARYLRVRPDDAGVWRELALCHDERKDAARAAEAYKKAAPNYPTDGAFLLKAARAVSKLDAAAGADLYAQCLPLLPRDPTPALELGRLKESARKPGEAMEAYSEALRRAPGLAEARNRMTALAASAREVDPWLPALVESEKKSPKDHALQFQLARAFSARGDSAKAFAYLDKALRQSGGKPEYRRLLPKVVREDAQISRHFAALEALRKEGDESPELFVLLCRGYSLAKNPAKAVAAAQELLRRDPVRLAGVRSAVFAAQAVKDPALTLRFADAYLARNPGDAEVRRLQVAAAVAGNAPAARQRDAIRALMALNPSEDDWLLRLAELDLAVRDSAAAFEHAQAWTRIHPDDAKGQILVRSLSQGRKDRVGAYLASLDRLSRLDTARHAEYELEIATHYLDENDPGKAVEIMGRLAEREGNDAWFWFRYGMAMRKLGREAAPQALERAWRLEPRNLAYALEFARVAEGDSMLAANVPALKMALQSPIGKTIPTLHAKYARACWFKGDADAAATEWEDMARSDPNAGVEDSTAVLAFLATNRRGRAAALLEKRAAKYPRETQTLARLADLYEKEGRTGDRTKTLEKLAQEDFSFGDYSLRLAREKAAARDYTEAVRLYSLWCLRYPQDKPSMKAYHDVAAAGGDSAALLEALRLITRQPDADKAYRYEQAEIFYARGGDPSELERLVQENPDYRKGRMLLAREYHGKRDFKNLARFDTFLEKESQSSSDLLEALGDLRAAQGKWDAANKAYFAWLSVRPKDPAAYAKVARAAKEHSSPYLVSILRMGAESRPEDTDVQAQYAVAQGKTPSALAVYEKLLAKRQDDLTLLIPAADLAKSLGRRDLALRWYEGWARLQPDEEKPWRALVELRGPAGDKRALAEALSGLFRLERSDFSLAVRLGKLREEIGQLDPALDAYRAALYLDPKNKSVRDKVIDLLRRQAGQNIAADLLTEIQTLDGGAHEAQFELARLHAKKGNRERAYAYLNSALEKSPRNPNYLALLPMAISSREQIAAHFPQLQELEKRPGLNKNDTANLSLFLQLARGYAMKNQWEAAAERFALAHRLRPQVLESDREALIAGSKAGNWQLVADLSDRWFRRHKDFDRDILQMQILAYEKTGRGDGAVRGVLRQLLNFDRENAGALLRLAELDIRAGDFAAAQTHIRECLMTHPDEAKAYVLLLPLIEGKPDQKISYVVVLEKLAQLDSARRAEYWLKLADFHEGRKNLREAHRLLALLTAAKPKQAPLWYRYGKIRTQIQVGDMGVSALRKAWNLEPANVEYARTYAQTLRNHEEIKDNLALFKFLDNKDPRASETRSLARSLLYNGEPKASAAAWDRVFRKPGELSDSADDGDVSAAYWVTSQWDKALPFFERRVARKSKPLPLLDTLHTLYARLNLEEKRVGVLRRIADRDPTYKDFQLRLAQAMEKRGETAEALEFYEQWVTRHPSQPEPLLAMRRLADSLHDTASLESALRRLVKLPRALPAHVCQLAVLEYRQSGEIQGLERAVKASPGFDAGKLLLAHEYFKRDQVPKLAPLEAEMIGAVGRDPEMQEALADLYVYQNKKDKAGAAYLAILRRRREALRGGDATAIPGFRTSLDKALGYAQATGSPAAEILNLGAEVFPGDANLAHALGAAWGSNAKSLAFHKQWLQTHPEDAVMVTRAAEMAARLESWPDALPLFRKWGVLQPAEIAAWKGLRAAAEKTGDAALQLAALQKLYDLSGGGEDAALAFALGSAIAKQGDRARAMEYLVRAADLKPGEKAYPQAVQDALEQLAQAALQSGNRAQAAEWYDQLLSRVPGHRKASLYQGLALAEARDCAAAAPLLQAGLQQSAEPSPVLAEAWRDLGQCQAGSNPSEAGEAFRRALVLNPVDTAAATGFLQTVLSLGKQEDFPAAYAAVIRVDSGQAEALTGLSAVRVAQGNYPEAAQLLRRLTLARPNDPAAQTDYGKALQTLDRFEEAKAAFTKAYALGDRGADVLGNLVRLHRKTGTLESALPILEEWVRQSPEDYEAAVWAAETAERKGNWTQAEEMWAAAWQADPKQLRYLAGLGRAYVRQGENDQAAQLLQPYAEQLDAAGLALLGDAYAGIPESDKAIAAYRRSRSLSPLPQAVAGEALVSLGRKQSRDAQKVLEENSAFSAKPEVGKARVRLFMLLRDFDKAVAVARGLAQTRPEDAEARALLGESLLAKHDAAAAVAALEPAAKLDTAHIRIRHSLGLAYLESGRTAEARAAFFALGDKPDRRARALGLLGLGEMARRMGHGTEAKDYWSQAASLHPSAQTFSDLAALCQSIGQVDEAEAFAQRALEIEEDFPDAVAALSETMQSRSQSKDALDYVREKLGENPASCELQLALNRILFESGDFKSLISSSNEARRLCPDDPMPWYYAGLAAAKTESKDAAAHFSRYKQLGGDPVKVPQGF